MKHSEGINELFSALAKAQAEMKPAILDSENPHFRSKYASLTSVQDAYRIPISKNSLTITQAVESIETGYEITTTLGHASGQWMQTSFKLILQKQDMQGLGSAITYAKRYSICALLGIVDQEDDDGNAARPKSVSVPTAKERPKFESVDFETGEFTPKEIQTLTERAYTLKAGKLKGKLLRDIAVSKLNEWIAWYDEKSKAGRLHQDIEDDAIQIRTFLESHE